MKRRRDVRTIRWRVSISPNEEQRLKRLQRREGRRSFAGMLHDLIVEALERKEPPEERR